MDHNRIDRAEYFIYCYAAELFIPLRILVSTDLELALNRSHHGLKRDELVILIYRLFQEHSLVANHDSKGLFTPSLDEIESALKENPEESSVETFYGITSGAMERFYALETMYHDTDLRPFDKANAEW